ncbi:hypothetical protein [Pseudomarimonas arenosa]|uniref:Uncharacterized protein n=1 Tax=Pseudomarimonas arenosa TaxID=2774145 RepID=A0AAW3ZNW4_9GAMM|nr:hypothetical protein [Pseudomarimonas arenosa]MBD8527868.1 hypothetical protein [Pseudomarimonas arenosa]
MADVAQRGEAALVEMGDVRANGTTRRAAWLLRWLSLALTFLVSPAALAECTKSLSQLRAQCTSVVECEEQSVHAANTLPAYLTALANTERNRVCEAAMECFKTASKLCTRACEADDKECSAHRSGERREWLRHLALKLESQLAPQQHQAPEEQSPSPLGPKNRYAGSINEDSKLSIAREFHRVLYDASCNSPGNCLDWAGQRFTLWHRNQSVLQSQADATKDSARRSTENAAVVGHSLNQVANAVETGAETTSIATVIGAEEMARAQLKIADQLSFKKEDDSSSDQEPSGDNQNEPAKSRINLAKATNAIAESQEQSARELAEAQLTSAQIIADAIERAVLGTRPLAPGSVARQVDPAGDFAELYPSASAFEYGILLVPDPQVPRHRRNYDLTISTVMQGMLRAGFVLDRYAVPWQQYINESEARERDPNASSSASEAKSDSRYGVLLFRADDWRVPEKSVCAKGADSAPSTPQPSTRIRVLYVVGETASFGVQREALVAALLRAQNRVSPRPTTKTNAKAADTPTPKHVRLRASGGWGGSGSDGAQCEEGKEVNKGNEKETTANRLLIIGPHFSGSMNSIREALSIARSTPSAESFATLHQRAPAFFEQIDRLGLNHHGARAWKATGCDRSSTSRVAGRALGISSSPHVCEGFTRSRSGRDQRNLLIKRISDLLRDAPDCLRKWIEDGSPTRQPTCEPGSEKAPEKTIWNDIQLSVHSPATTNPTNARLNDRAHGSITYQTWAVTDDEKLAKLEDRFGEQSGDEGVVLFAEDSTFGSGICPRQLPDCNPGNQTCTNRNKFCGRALEIPFPANIADIRFGARERSRKQKSTAMHALGLPELETELSLADGSENGSEFPDSQRSPLTTASAEMELEASLREVTARQPRLIVVAATDVRDRLFLFDRLRTAAPKALLVDLEADVLMAHSSAAHASRGSLILSSRKLQIRDGREGGEGRKGASQVSHFSTDKHASLFEIIRNLQPSASAFRPGVLTFYTPTRHGLADISRDIDSMSGESVGRTSVGWTSVLLGLSLVLLAGHLLVLVLRRSVVFDMQWLPLSWWISRELQGPTLGTDVVRGLAALVLSLTLLAGFALVGCGVQSGKSLDSTAPDLLSGISAPLAQVLVAAGAAFLLISILLFARRLGRMRGYMGSPPGSSRQLLVLPLEISNGLIFTPVAIAGLAWAWVVATPFGSIDPQTWVRMSWLGASEYWFLFGQLLMAMGMVIGFSIAAAWLQCIWRCESRIEHVVHRYRARVAPDQSRLLPSWDELPAAALMYSPADGGKSGTDCSYVGTSDDHIRATWLHPNFSSTPMLVAQSDFRWLAETVLAGPTDSRPLSDTELAQKIGKDLRAISLQYEDGVRSRAVISAVLADMVQGLRHGLYLGFGQALLLVALGYAYPVTSRDSILLFTLAMLVMGSLLSAYALLRLERSRVVSRLLCDTDEHLQLSWPLIMALLTPAFAFLAAIMVLEVPGVLAWGAGLLGPLTAILGF